MNVLALDLATKTGWAHTCGESGMQSFATRRGDSPGMKWIEFRAWLVRLLDLVPVDLIVYEQAHHRGGAATHVAHALISTVEAVAAERGIEVTSRHTATIKKHAVGKGNAGKEEMVEAAEECFGREGEVMDDNRADALWLLHLVMRDLDPNWEWSG